MAKIAKRDISPILSEFRALLMGVSVCTLLDIVAQRMLIIPLHNALLTKHFILSLIAKTSESVAL